MVMVLGLKCQKWLKIAFCPLFCLVKMQKMADFCGFANEKCPAGRKNVCFLCVGVGDKCKKSVMGLIFCCYLLYL